MEETIPDAHWNDWYQRHGPRLLLCARQWTSRVSDAEDVVQEGFARYWRHQRALGGDAFPWVLASIRRAALDLGRRNSRRAAREERAQESPEPESPWFESTFGPDSCLGPGDRAAVVEAALRDLPPEQREVVVLKIWGELTFDQIGAQLSIPANTAASRYRYGLIALRKALILSKRP